MQREQKGRGCEKLWLKKGKDAGLALPLCHAVSIGQGRVQGGAEQLRGECKHCFLLPEERRKATKQHEEIMDEISSGGGLIGQKLACR